MVSDTLLESCEMIDCQNVVFNTALLSEDIYPTLIFQQPSTADTDSRTCKATLETPALCPLSLLLPLIEPSFMVYWCSSFLLGYVAYVVFTDISARGLLSRGSRWALGWTGVCKVVNGNQANT